MDACQACLKTELFNHTTLDILHDNMTSSLANHFKTDLLLFNPPYVFSSEEELIQAQQHPNSMTALSGGKDGSAILFKFLEIIPTILSNVGVCYVVVIDYNDLSKIVNYLRSLGLNGDVIREGRNSFEKLYILKISFLNE
ncbi:hypothetical protein GEMRC1_005357 [Eukaryota sp. GEM-RC1]